MSVIYKGIYGRSATNSKGTRTYIEKHRLETTSITDGSYAVGSDPNLPLIGSAHYDDSSAWCVSLDVDNDNPWKGWTVTATYDSTFELNINPIFEPAQISWDFEQYERVAMVDRSGDAICNSAGDFYVDPPAMRDDSRPVVSVSKNLAAVPSYVLTYQDAVNSSAFTLDGLAIAAGLAKCNRVSISTQQERNGFQFRTVTFDIHLQRDGWALSLLDYGYRAKSGSDRNLITNTDGTEPKNPVLLDGSGAALSPPTAATAVYNSFNVYYAADFNLLPLT